jgi:hypothetical protein
MTKEYIFESFKNLKSNKEKAEYIKSLENLNLPFDFNYTNLIAAWESKSEKSAD